MENESVLAAGTSTPRRILSNDGRQYTELNVYTYVRSYTCTWGKHIVKGTSTSPNEIDASISVINGELRQRRTWSWR